MPADVTTVEDLLAEAAQKRDVVALVLLRQDLLDRHEALTAELTRAVESDSAAKAGEGMDDAGVLTAPAIAQKIVDLEAEIDEAKRPFVFHKVGHRAWRDLLADHPPTKEQKADYRGIDHNPETFPAAAIAASCASPKMTLEQVLQFEQVMSEAQWAVLWAKCLEANAGNSDTPKSTLAGAIARVNAELEALPPDLTLPAASSLDE